MACLGTSSRKAWKAIESLIYGPKSPIIGGEGLAQGADFTAGKIHYRWLVKQGRMREAGALMFKLTGALWSPQQPVEQEMVASDATEAKCPLCGEQEAYRGHLFWDCPGVQPWLTPSSQRQTGAVESM